MCNIDEILISTIEPKNIHGNSGSSGFADSHNHGTSETVGGSTGFSQSPNVYNSGTGSKGSHSSVDGFDSLHTAFVHDTPEKSFGGAHSTPISHSGKINFVIHSL